jgi:hypothetical protein
MGPAVRYFPFFGSEVGPMPLRVPRVTEQGRVRKEVNGDTGLDESDPVNVNRQYVGSLADSRVCDSTPERMGIVQRLAEGKEG